LNGSDKAPGSSVAIAILALMAGPTVFFLVWLKEIAWDFIKGRKTDTVRPATLKDILLIVLMFPLYLTGLVGAVWLFYKEWDEFTRVTLLCAEGSLRLDFSQH
jgi:hypothetical protein